MALSDEHAGRAVRTGSGEQAQRSAAAGRRLVVAGWVFGAATLLHVADHLRRGQGSITEPLYWAGNFALILQVALVTLIVTRHRVAPLAAVAIGFPLAIGFFAAHWLPEWSALSDPVLQVADAPALSVVASALEVLAAAAVGFAGLAVLRIGGLASAVGRSVPPRPI